jgi:uncharacterized protein YutE (UPF0331/DUF86 family)
MWAAVDSAAATLLDRKSLKVRAGDRYPTVGGGTMMKALGAAGLISDQQLRELDELREVRNRLVHLGSENPPEINREMIDRLKQARSSIENQIEAR